MVRYSYRVTSAQIESAVVTVLREVQALSDNACPDLEPGLKPMKDLDGFDSLVGLEATVMLEVQLGSKLGCDNIFLDEQTNRLLAVHEVVVRVGECLTSEGTNG